MLIASCFEVLCYFILQSLYILYTYCKLKSISYIIIPPLTIPEKIMFQEVYIREKLIQKSIVFLSVYLFNSVKDRISLTSTLKAFSSIVSSPYLLFASGVHRWGSLLQIASAISWTGLLYLFYDIFQCRYFKMGYINLLRPVDYKSHSFVMKSDCKKWIFVKDRRKYIFLLPD